MVHDLKNWDTKEYSISKETKQEVVLNHLKSDRRGIG